MSATSLLDAEQLAAICRDSAQAISTELRKAARKARAPQPVLSGGGGFRARKSDRYFSRLLGLLLTVLFVIPVCGSVVYYGLIAADQYVTETRFAVRSGGDTSVTGLAGLSSFIDTGQARDGLIIADYVKSSALIQAIGGSFDLRAIFSKPEHDLLARFDPSGSAEDFLEYWEDQIYVYVDRTSGLVTLSLSTFTPEDGLDLTKRVITEAEAMVNKLTRKSEADALLTAERELSQKRTRLETVISELRDSRNSAGILDVEMAAKAYTELLTTLRLELSKQEMTIDVTSASSPQMQPLVNRANVLRAKIAEYERAIAGNTPVSHIRNANLAEVSTDIQKKELELSIAREEYASAMAAYEGARLNSDRQRSYLLTYVQPILAQEPTKPLRILMCLAVLAVSALVTSIAVGLAFLVRDHMAK